jgi:nitrogen regulatory protein P-II 2
MKLVVAVIKKHKESDVTDALLEEGILGITSWEVSGFGKEHKEQVELYRGKEYHLKFKPMKLFMVAVLDDMVEDVMKIIREHANTHEISAGKIFVLNLEDALRIRTGQIGEDALL